MPHLPYPSPDQIQPEVRAVLDRFEKAYGRPSHIFRAMAWNGRVVQAAAQAWHQLVVEPSTLPRWVKEAVVVITCTTQQTPYCVQGHSHALRRQGLSENQVQAIQSHSFEGFADPELSIFRFAHKAAANAKSLQEADYRGLQDLHLSNESILEILGVIWANTAMNMIVDALGVTRTDQQMTELSAKVS
jgi:uncharacterized peroxidase-related enzyme